MTDATEYGKENEKSGHVGGVLHEVGSQEIIDHSNHNDAPEQHEES